MARVIRFIGILIISVVITGCVGIGVVKTSDPKQKLNDAKHLFQKQDRPLLAEGLILEAIEIFEAKKDYHWLGHSYRDYGDFLRSKAVTRHGHVYEKYGFQDKTITFKKRWWIAKEKFNQAIEYYKSSEANLIAEKKFDALTNVYFNLAWTYYRNEGSDDVICDYFLKTEQAYAKNIQQNPTAKPNFDPAYASFKDEINHYKKQFSC